MLNDPSKKIKRDKFCLNSAPPPRYHPRIGFIVEFDYILHIPGHYENVRVVYGVYRNGLVVDPPRSIEWKHIKTKAFEKDRYGYAVFNSLNLLKNSTNITSNTKI